MTRTGTWYRAASRPISCMASPQWASTAGQAAHRHGVFDLIDDLPIDGHTIGKRNLNVHWPTTLCRGQFAVDSQADVPSQTGRRIVLLYPYCNTIMSGVKRENNFFAAANCETLSFSQNASTRLGPNLFSAPSELNKIDLRNAELICRVCIR